MLHIGEPLLSRSGHGCFGFLACPDQLPPPETKTLNFQLAKHSKFYFQKDSDVFQNLQIIPKSAQVLCHKAFVGFPFENWRDVVHILDAANVIVG